MSSDAWLLFPLMLIVLMTKASPLSPVPLMMLLIMTKTFDKLLPQPIPLLDYPLFNAPSPSSGSSTTVDAAAAHETRRHSAAAASLQLTALGSPSAPVADAPAQQRPEDEPATDMGADMSAALREKRGRLHALVKERLGVPTFRSAADAFLPSALFPGARQRLGIT